MAFHGCVTSVGVSISRSCLFSPSILFSYCITCVENKISFI